MEQVVLLFSRRCHSVQLLAQGFNNNQFSLYSIGVTYLWQRGTIYHLPIFCQVLLEKLPYANITNCLTKMDLIFSEHVHMEYKERQFFLFRSFNAIFLQCLPKFAMIF